MTSGISGSNGGGIQTVGSTLFKDIVLHGAVAPAGMERFDDILSETDD
jgi:hypothetical protein